MRDPLKRIDEEGRFVESAIQPDMGFPEVGLLDNRNAKELVRNSGVDIRNGEGFVKLILADSPHGENRVRMMQNEPYSGPSSGHLNVSGVYTDVKNPNMVTIIGEFPSAAAARQEWASDFVESEQMRAPWAASTLHCCSRRGTSNPTPIMYPSGQRESTEMVPPGRLD